MWLPVREAEVERVVSSAPPQAANLLRAAATRVNEELRRDERAAAAGWVVIK